MPRKLPPSAFDFKTARKARKMSQQKAAVLLFATQPSISRWEADGTMPEIYKMAWLLYWQLEDMKHGEGSTDKRSVSRRSAKSGKAGSGNGRRSVIKSASGTDKGGKRVEKSAVEILQQLASEKPLSGDSDVECS